MQNKKAFTLIELLVVVTIIVVLLALLVPAMDKAIYAAVIATCAARHHGLNNIFNEYALSVSSQRLFPSGKREGRGEHATFVGTGLVDLVVSRTGNKQNKHDPNSGSVQWGIVPEMLTDPSFGNFGYFKPNNDNYGGWVIGYNYLGGHDALSQVNKPSYHAGSGADHPKTWDSPIGLARTGSGMLTACHLSWDNTGAWSIVAHSKEGGALGSNAQPRAYFYDAAGDKDPRRLGGAGANIGYVDGAVVWKEIEKTRMWWSHAENGAPGPWPALW